MTGAPAEIIALLLLLLTLSAAIVRPGGLNEAAVALPAAALVVITGSVPVDAMTTTLRELGPTVVLRGLHWRFSPSR